MSHRKGPEIYENPIFFPASAQLHKKNGWLEDDVFIFIFPGPVSLFIAITIVYFFGKFFRSQSNPSNDRPVIQS